MKSVLNLPEERKGFTRQKSVTVKKDKTKKKWVPKKSLSIYTGRKCTTPTPTLFVVFFFLDIDVVFAWAGGVMEFQRILRSFSAIV